jgi:hypothetical protein
VDSQIFPGIIMVGAVPTFYRIPITATLVNHVQAGSFPPQPTVVQRCVPPVPNPIAYPEEGLAPLPMIELLFCSVFKRSKHLS